MRTTRRGWTRAFVGVGLLLLAVPAVWAFGGKGSREQSPLVIGHRGAAGYLPDHTLEGYALAIKLGADYIEPDLVATKDGHLIARHEPNITTTTDVASHPEFADREAHAVVDGVAEDRLLRVRLHARRDQEPCAPSSRFGRTTAAVQRPLRDPDARARSSSLRSASRRRKAARSASIPRPSTRPTTVDSGCRSSTRLVDRCCAGPGWNHRDAPVFIQSFEQSNLKALRKMTPVRLVQLVDANDVNADGTLDFTRRRSTGPTTGRSRAIPSSSAARSASSRPTRVCEEISTYADGIGPWKRYIVSSRAIALNPDGTVADANGDGLVNETDRELLPPTDLVDRAHDHGLLIHTWTFRNEQRRLTSDFGGNPVNEYLLFYELGVDGVFSDFADTAFAARELFRLE